MQQQIAHLTGPVLSLAEGEGSNADFLVQQGFEVVGVDSSAIGLAKTENVTIATVQVNLAEYQPTVNYFANVVPIFLFICPSNCEAYCITD